MTGRMVALVTGISSGIGRTTAQRLVTLGFRVFGTMRRPVPLAGVEVLPLDVRDDVAVDMCVDDVLARAGRLDVIVNSAGVSLLGALEETSTAEAKALFDTNFFGVLRITCAALPTMRQQGAGHVVIVGSIAGFLPKPFEGIYVASKHALDGYAETLAHEVRQFGVRVSLIESGFMQTVPSHSLREVASPLHAYTESRQRTRAMRRHHVASSADPSLVADTVAHAVMSASPRLRYVVGSDARRLLVLRALLPEAVFARGLRRRFGLE